MDVAFDKYYPYNTSTEIKVELINFMERLHYVLIQITYKSLLLLGAVSFKSKKSKFINCLIKIFKFINFEKTKFIDFEKMKFKFIDFEKTKFKFKFMKNS